MHEANLVDFHCHLDLHPDMQKAFDRCEQIKCTTLTVTTTPKAYQRNAEFASRTKYVKAALGLHPQLVAKRGAEIDLFEDIAKDTRYIGEIGLDASPVHYPSFNRQREVFERALRVCVFQGEKVISVHSVRCARLVIEAIKNSGVCRNCIVILHWFSGGRSEIEKAIGLGCWFSINEKMAYSKSGLEVLSLVPRDRILTETDAPFLVSERGVLEAGDVIPALKAIGAYYGIDHDAVRTLVAENAQKLLI